MSFDLDQFVKICGLLGSEHDGERAAAAHRAQDMLTKANLTWRDVIVSPTRQKPAPTIGAAQTFRPATSAAEAQRRADIFARYEFEMRMRQAADLRK